MSNNFRFFPENRTLYFTNGRTNNLFPGREHFCRLKKLSAPCSATAKAATAPKASSSAKTPTSKTTGPPADGRGEEKDGSECKPYSHCPCRDAGLGDIDVERRHCALDFVANA
jgi:hypothetical protein